MNADDIDPNDPDYFAKIHAQVEMWDREARRGLRIEQELRSQYDQLAGELLQRAGDMTPEQCQQLQVEMERLRRKELSIYVARIEAEAEGRRLEALQANQQLLLQQAYLGNANN